MSFPLPTLLFQEIHIVNESTLSHHVRLFLAVSGNYVAILGTTQAKQKHGFNPNDFSKFLLIFFFTARSSCEKERI